MVSQQARFDIFLLFARWFLMSLLGQALVWIGLVLR